MECRRIISPSGLLIATGSTTFDEPYHVARRFASLDHISSGRVGWNIVTTWSPQAGSNFGGIGQVGHADRYERAEDYMSVVKGLWDSWADDAVLDDRAGVGRCAGIALIPKRFVLHPPKAPARLVRNDRGVHKPTPQHVTHHRVSRLVIGRFL